MEVRPGYRQTEVGVLPEQWKVSTLGQVCSFENGDRSSNYPSPGAFRQSGVPFINAGHVSDGQISFSEMNYITQEAFARLGGGKVRAGDILFCLRGSLGKFGVVSSNFGDGAIASSLVIVRPKAATVAREYLICYFSSSICAQMIELWSGGAAQPNLGAKDLARFSIPLPSSLPEQRAIATALSDVDALLGALDRLIAKKRDLKQAAMQQLLTGQTRLPGFHGQWEVKRFGTLLRFQVGFPFSSAFFNEKGEGIRLVKNRDLKSDDQVFHYNGKYEETFVVHDGDVLIGMDGDFLPCRWNKGHALLNQRVGRVVPNKELNATFAYYALIEPLKEIESVTSSTTVKHLSHGDVEGIECPIPEYAEQTAIAEVLSDVDAEIAALEQRREKTRAVKQGMMQELLTGRVRLTNGEGRIENGE